MSVAVAVGATVLKIVVKPDDSPFVLVSGGAPPEGSTTIVPGRFDTGMVMSPLPAVTVMIAPAVGVAVAVTVSVTLEVAVALPVTSDVAVPVAFPVPVVEERPEVLLELTRPGMRSRGGGLDACGCACTALSADVHESESETWSLST